jgi:hypothetical protein
MNRSGEGGLIVTGFLSFRSSYEGYVIEDGYRVEISGLENYPHEIPVVRELNNRIPRLSDNHAYKDGTLCLATPLGLHQSFFESPILLDFIEKLLIPYLYGHTYWERKGVYPWGEASHGNTGVKASYAELFEVSDDLAIVKFLRYLAMGNYRGHHFCNCGSGKRLRDCHGHTLMSLKNLPQRLFMDDFVSCLDSYLKRHPSKAKEAAWLISKKTKRIARRLGSIPSKAS